MSRSWVRGLVCIAIFVLVALLTDAWSGRWFPKSADGQLIGVAWLVGIAFTYGVIWPLGTFTHGRPKTAWSSVFGLLWGIGQSAAFLSIVALIAKAKLHDAETWALCFALISMLQGLWHGLWWDRYVSPDHNDPAWNLRKVIFCHIPNLILGLWLVVRFDAVGLFSIGQTLALTLSARAMRFPSPLESLGVDTRRAST